VLHVRSRNEIGDEQTRKLYIEIMGRHSNLILVEDETEQIIDGLKHLSPSVNSYRTVLPGHQYLLPPAQQKLNPFDVTKEDILKHLRFQEG
ncbi:NFACT family protein, partial [Bacillus subtilis]